MRCNPYCPKYRSYIEVANGKVEWVVTCCLLESEVARDEIGGTPRGLECIAPPDTVRGALKHAIDIINWMLEQLDSETAKEAV